MPQASQLEDLTSWLEWAGGKLVALPAFGLRPAQPRAYWPDFSQEKFQVLEFRARLVARALAPTSSEIELMDEILYTIRYVKGKDPSDGDLRRRVLQARALTHPITERNIVSWTELARREHTSEFKVKALHLRALRELWRETPDSKLESLTLKFDQIARAE